jgi:Mn-dependent DtxR family transcriptional regulator
LVEFCGVSQRNAEKMVERWKAEGYIRMKEYMLYEKIIPELL